LERLEIYNLAAQSHVKISFDNPVYTGNTDAIGVLNILESVRNLNLYRFIAKPAKGKTERNFRKSILLIDDDQ
jgi:GDP-D-mannose dehydratase